MHYGTFSHVESESHLEGESSNSNDLLFDSCKPTTFRHTHSLAAMEVIGYQCHLCGLVEMSMIQDHLRKKCRTLRPLPQTAPALDPNRSDDKTAKSPPVTKSPSVAKSPPVTAMLLAESKESTPPAAKKLKPESSHAVSPPATKQLKPDVSDAAVSPAESKESTPPATKKLKPESSDAVSPPGTKMLKPDVSDAAVSPPATKKLKPLSSDTASSPAVQSPWIWIDVPGSGANGDQAELKCIECGICFSKLPRLEQHYMEVHVETSDQPSSTETCPICNIRLVDTYTTGCFFSKGPTQKSFKYGIGPSQQDKIAKYTGPTQSYQKRLCNV